VVALLGPMHQNSGFQNTVGTAYSTSDMPPLESNNACRSRTGPIRCAESRRAIRFGVASFVVAKEQETLRFSEFSTPD